jgi:tetratricopeptide (TPR) repeat protein
MNSAELEQLRQAVQAAPQDIETRLTLLQALVATASWQEAEDVGTALLQHEPPPAAVHALMGIIYGKRQRWNDAIHQCQCALETQPDDALLLFNLGTLLAQRGELPAAQTHLEKALVQHAQWAEAQYNLGIVLLRQERYREAIDAFKRASDVRELYPEAHFSRGNAHAMRGLDTDGTLDYYELDCAINAYKTAIQQRPGYTAALFNLGMIYGRMTSAEGVRVWDQYLEATQEKPEEDTWRLRAQEYKRDLQDRLR